MAEAVRTATLRAALGEIAPRLRRFAIALTGSVSEADDLVQEACERALLNSDQLRDRNRLDAWMYRIMRHRWIDELRARRVRRHDSMEAAEGVVGDDGEATAENRLMLASVRRCLHELSAEHRSVLMLVCVDGLSYRETAEILGVPIGTVMSRVSRARQDLHDKLIRRGPSGTVTVLPVSPDRDRVRKT